MQYFRLKVAPAMYLYFKKILLHQ